MKGETPIHKILKLIELDENLWRKSLEKEGGGLQTEPWGPSVYELRLP